MPNDSHHRRTIRLQSYDYSQPGSYYVTICTQDKKCMFGKIVNSEMYLNNVGQIVRAMWNTLPERFPNVELDQYVVMPNHFHGIITLIGSQFIVHEDSYTSDVPERFKPYMAAMGTLPAAPRHATPPHPWDPIYRVPTGTPTPQQGGTIHSDPMDAPTSEQGNTISHSPILGEIVRTFKGASTYHIRSSGRPDFGWQSRYYEHIIRNDDDLYHTREYIINNPARWAEDSLYTEDSLNIEESITQ